MVKFDVDSDGRFQGIYPLSILVDVLQCLSEITAKAYTWDQFTANHGWIPKPLYGQDTYPSAHELHAFYVVAKTGIVYEVTAYTFDQVVVICAMAIEVS